jgi:hypothetical protein
VITDPTIASKGKPASADRPRFTFRAKSVRLPSRTDQHALR